MSNSMAPWQSVFILLVCLYGCSSVPFQKTVYVPLDTEDPWRIAERFKDSSPSHFELINTIVFEYNWNKFSAIGYIYVDTDDKAFRVMCMNPMGVRLFELSGDKAGIVPHFVLEQFSQKGDFAATVGEDIRRIYFDLTPSPGARVSSRRYKVMFRETAGEGVIEYVYAGAGGYLVEKNYYEDSSLNWGISYYEYLDKGGSIYPGGIILNNYKYGYRLTVRLKEVQT